MNTSDVEPNVLLLTIDASMDRAYLKQEVDKAICKIVSLVAVDNKQILKVQTTSDNWATAEKYLSANPKFKVSRHAALRCYQGSIDCSQSCGVGGPCPNHFQIVSEPKIKSSSDKTIVDNGAVKNSSTCTDCQTFPNDPLFAFQRKALNLIRATAQWQKSNGVMEIGFIDTGCSNSDDFSMINRGFDCSGQINAKPYYGSNVAYIGPEPQPENWLDDKYWAPTSDRLWTNYTAIQDLGWTGGNADVYGHGTSTAGVACEQVNNGQAGAGICRGCTPVPYRISRTKNATTDWPNICGALQTAGWRPQRIVNMSYGFSQHSTLEMIDDLAIGNAIRMYTHGFFMGTGDHNLLFCSANESHDGSPGLEENGTPPDPAQSADGLCILVGSCDSDGRVASTSNYGGRISFYMPGDSVYGLGLNNTVKVTGGTSFASPMASAAAAMVWGSNPKLKAEEVVDILRKTASNQGKYNGDVQSCYEKDNTRPGEIALDENNRPRIDASKLGYGIINIEAAVSEAYRRAQQ